MQEFSQEIIADSQGACTFSFNRLYTANSFVYYVTTSSGAEGGHAFTMAPKPTGGWRIINAPKVPDWIEKLEAELSAAIINNDMERH